MTTTIMRDSKVGDKWIADMCELNPVQRVLNEAGNFTGNITTGPVRLVFCDTLIDGGPAMKSDPNSRIVHAVTLLFPPQAKLDIFWEEFNRVAGAEFSDHFDAASGKYYGLDVPLYDQGTKLKYSGFTPGCQALNTSSQFKPPVVDTRGLPVTDKAKVYAGAWAIVSLNAYASGKGKPRKGPRFGLQTVMIIADDTNLAQGAQPDTKEIYKSVNVRPPMSAPANVFAQQNQPPAGPPATAAFSGSYGTPAPAAPAAVVPAADDWMSGFS